jgi:hypothetical protein
MSSSMSSSSASSSSSSSSSGKRSGAKRAKKESCFTTARCLQCGAEHDIQTFTTNLGMKFAVCEMHRDAMSDFVISVKNGPRIYYARKLTINRLDSDAEDDDDDDLDSEAAVQEFETQAAFVHFCETLKVQKKQRQYQFGVSTYAGGDLILTYWMGDGLETRPDSDGYNPSDWKRMLKWVNTDWSIEDPIEEISSIDDADAVLTLNWRAYIDFLQQRVAEQRDVLDEVESMIGTIEKLAD